MFSRLLSVLAAISSCAPLSGDVNDGPSYTAAGIVNAADNETHSLAPNTLASLYGVRLSYVTAAISPSDIQGGVLPTVLPGTGVHVTVGNLPATMYYVSPDQINFLVPANLLPGRVHCSGCFGRPQRPRNQDHPRRRFASLVSTGREDRGRDSP